MLYHCSSACLAGLVRGSRPQGTTALARVPPARQAPALLTRVHRRLGHLLPVKHWAATMQRLQSLQTRQHCPLLTVGGVSAVVVCHLPQCSLALHCCAQNSPRGTRSRVLSPAGAHLGLYWLRHDRDATLHLAICPSPVACSDRSADRCRLTT